MKSFKAVKEFSISQHELNKKLFTLILPFIILLSVPYFVFWSKSFWLNLKMVVITNFYYTLLTLLLGIVLHELLHGLSWALFANKSIKSIKFGFSKKNFTPYCHFLEPIRLKHYIWGGLMPAFVLGMIPIVISWFNGNSGLFIFGIVFILASGSDILICLKLIKQDKNILVQDFPDRPGCYIVD